MANTKISQLPEWTGTAADLRWFVMNNSGETETFKFSGYTSPFRKADGFNSVISNYYLPSAVPQLLSGIIGGTGNTMSATSSYTDGFSNYIFAGTGNVMNLNSPAPGQNYGHTIIGGNYNTLRFRANASVNTMIGGQSNTMDCYYGANTIIGGSNNTSQAASTSTIISAQASQILSGDRMGIWGGYSCSINGGSDNNIYGGFDHTIAAGDFNTIIGGFTNTITSGQYNFIAGGQNNTTAAALNRVAMIACSGRTASASNTTYVENIHSYRTPSTEVQPVFSGTVFTCNLENGAKSQFYITGTSTINITNVRDGASFMIKTQTTGNYVMTWTATGGYTFVFEGGIKDPGNNVTDIFVFEVFGSVIYGSRRHNYS